MRLNVTNETAQLETVILGIGKDKGNPRPINPSIREHLENNTYPTEEDICKEIKTFEDVLIDNGVEVLRPKNLLGINQIFTRDIGFVIDDCFLVSNLKFESRAKEQAGINDILAKIQQDKIIHVPKNVAVEGGDVIVHNNFVFVGISDRTSANAVPFLKECFPKKEVIGFELLLDEHNADTNILHLDCAFQPVGNESAILFQDGFKQSPKVLLDIFKKENIIEVSLDEKIKMFPNIFSISPTKVVVEKNFTRLKKELEARDIEIFEVDYQETSKLSGLLRCSTLPLKRKSLY